MGADVLKNVFLALIFLGSPVAAMTISEAGPPADFPPKGYTGMQFVDARGCAYVRTGTVDRPNWVPRVERTGDVICGLVPTFAAAATTVTPAEPETPPELQDPVVVPPSNTPVLSKQPKAKTGSGSGLPAGYKPAWNDGRLNPLRGPRSDG